MKVTKGIKIEGREVDVAFPYKVWFNKANKQVQGQAPFYMVVVDPDKELPAIIQKPKEIEGRNALLIVFK